MADFDVTSRKELENWLTTQPRDVSVAIAARAALRVLPILATAFRGFRKAGTITRSIVLPLIRGSAMSLVAAKYPTKRNSLSGFAAARASATDAAAAADAFAGDAAAARATLPSSRSGHLWDDSSSARADRARVEAMHAGDTKAALAAARAADAGYAAYAANSERDAAYAARLAIAASFAAAYHSSIEGNHPAIQATLSDAEFILKGGFPEDLTRQRLWRIGIPRRVGELWAELAESLHSIDGEVWGVWTNLYDAVLRANPMPGGEELDIYRVTLGGEDHWDKGPADVNALIKKKEEEIALRGAADLSQYPASYSFDFRDGKLEARPLLGGGESAEADDIRMEVAAKLRKSAARLRLNRPGIAGGLLV
ncbi:MAG: hypothetical protein HY245_10815 [Rhizobiales bacterium]|nr:hypothetical protein [Hyphomicrobiales bacterium]